MEIDFLREAAPFLMGVAYCCAATCFAGDPPELVEYDQICLGFCALADLGVATSYMAGALALGMPYAFLAVIIDTSLVYTGPSSSPGSSSGRPSSCLNRPGPGLPRLPPPEVNRVDFPLQLVIHLSDHAYEVLKQVAQWRNTTPEVLLESLVTEQLPAGFASGEAGVFPCAWLR